MNGELEHTISSRDALKKQLHEAKRQFFDAMNSMRIEKTTLLADVQSQIFNERVALKNHVQGMVCGYVERAKGFQLEQSMSHSVAMSTMKSETRLVESLLSTERERTSSLQSSLDRAMADNLILTGIVDSACRKHSVFEKESLADAIDTFLTDRSEVRALVGNLEVDVTTLKSNNINLQREHDNLAAEILEKENQVKEFESNLERDRSALKAQTKETKILEKKLENLKREAQRVHVKIKQAFDADRMAQDKSVEEIILAREEALSQQEALRVQVEACTKEITIRDERLAAVQATAEKLSRECQVAAESLESANAELLKVKESHMKGDKEVEQILLEKDNTLAKVQSDFSEYAADKTAGAKNLQSMIQQLEQELEHTTSSREALKKQNLDLHQRFSHAMNSMRTENTTLLADVKSQILAETLALKNQVKVMVSSLGERVESKSTEKLF